MLGTVMLFGILSGADNLQACSAIGLLRIPRSRRHLLAVAFTSCETLTPVAGLALGHLLLRCAGDAVAKICPFMTLACGIAIPVCAFRDELPSLVNERNFTVGMPVALSFDNLLAGAGISSLHYPVAISALIVGLVSGSMSCIGLYLGAWTQRFLPSRIEFAVGAYLCFLGGRALSMSGA